MPKINITFEEEGQTPVVLEIPESTVAALEAFIQEQNNLNKSPLPPKQNPEDPDPPQPLKYNGKADLFLQHTSNTLLEPIIKRFGTSIVQTDSTLLEQIQDLELQKKALEEQFSNSFKPRFL